MQGALSGIRVIDLTNYVFGPVTTQLLGDMGAEVIKVEPPAGDPMRQVGKSNSPHMGSSFLNLNRNKKSVVLDLKQSAAQNSLHQLLETADVLVHNLRSESLKKLGLDYPTIQSQYPQLIYASALGFGAQGCYFDRPAYDDIIQGLSAMVDLNQKNADQALYMPMLFTDKLCGLVLYGAITTALFHREETGLGQQVSVPMLETAVSFNLLDHMADGIFQRQSAQNKPGYQRVLSHYHRPLRTSDGVLCLVANSDRQWQRLFSLLGVPELTHDERFIGIGNRIKNIEALYEIVEEKLQTHTTEHWLTKFEQAEIPASPANTLEGLTQDPHLVQAEFFKETDHPSEGKLLSPDLFMQFSQTPGTIAGPAPRLGEHTEEVLGDLNGSTDVQ